MVYLAVVPFVVALDDLQVIGVGFLDFLATSFWLHNRVEGALRNGEFFWGIAWDS